jgi:hypothetical protein
MSVGGVMEDYKLRDLLDSYTHTWLFGFGEKQVKFICSRIKKRRKPRVKIVTLKLD